MPVANVTKRVRYYVTNQAAGTVSIVDGFTNSIVQTIPVGAEPTTVVASKDNTIYVANRLSDTVTIICIDGSTRTLSIKNNGYLDVDVITGRLYVADDTTVSVYDIASGSLIYTLTGFTAVSYIKLNHSRNKLFVIDNGTLKIYSTSTFDLVKTLVVGAGANFVLITPDDLRAYVSFSAGIAVFDLATYTLLTSITDPLIISPAGLVLKGNVLYVANNFLVGTVVRVDVLTYSVIGLAITVGANPTRLAISPDGLRLYVTNNGLASTIVSIIDLITNLPLLPIPGFAQPFDIVGVYLGSSISPGDPIDLTDDYQIDDIKESVCILARKVFAHCQQRVCFPMVRTPLMPGPIPPFTILDITFKNGFIVPGSEIRTPIEARPNFERVQFKVRVPYTINFKDTAGTNFSVNGFLDDIEKDIVMFIPQARSEFIFETVVETRSDLLNTPTFVNNEFRFAVGVFVVVKIVGEVQLLLPAFGYCPEPPECEEYIEPSDEDVCKIFVDFSQTPFPDDFFPPQYEEINCKI